MNQNNMNKLILTLCLISLFMFLSIIFVSADVEEDTEFMMDPVSTWNDSTWGNNPSDYSVSFPWYGITIASRNIARIYGQDQFEENTKFVSVNGTDFYLNGRPFYFAGTNAYYLWYGDMDCTSPSYNQGCVIPLLDSAQSLGLKVIRTWGFSNGNYKYGNCFQPSPGVYDETTFAHFDRVIKESSDRDLKLIVTLVNNWDDFGGMNKYNQWCGLTNHDDFYTSECTKQLYKDYVNHFLNRVNSLTGVKYKDDPTIFAWELANEPRCRSDTSGETLNEWIGEMSAYIKSIDPIHLVTTGVDGGYVDKGSNPYAWWYKGNEGQDYYANHEWDTIDYATFHYYRSMDYNINANTWINEHIDDAHDIIGKPVLFGEFNDQTNKTGKLTEWYNILETQGCNGDTFWMLSQDNIINNDDGYFILCPDDTEECDIISEHATFMNRMTGLPAIIYDYSPEGNVTLIEGETQNFEIYFEDNDSSEINISWYVDGIGIVSEKTIDISETHQGYDSYLFDSSEGGSIIYAFVMDETEPTGNVQKVWHVNITEDCENECANYGEHSCTDDFSYEICGDWDDDSCYEWSSDIDCSIGQTCESGNCVDNIEIECFEDSECGTDGYISENYCITSQYVHRRYRTYSCENPRTENAECSYSDSNILIDECSGDDRCYDGQCEQVECSSGSECGDSEYVGDQYCLYGNHVYQKYRMWDCENSGSPDSYCTYSDIDRQISNCNLDNKICYNGECIPTVIECSTELDCGTDEDIGERFCENGNVYQTYRNYNCENPNTENATCTYSELDVHKETCHNGKYCSDGECVQSVCSSSSNCGDNDFVGDPFCLYGHVYQKYRNWDCENSGTEDAECSYMDTNYQISSCDSGEICSDGECIVEEIECSTSSDCGINGYVGNPFCNANDIYQKYRTWNCNDAGTPDSQCSYQDLDDQISSCDSNELCVDGECIEGDVECSSKTDCGTDSYMGESYCETGNVYQTYRTYICENQGTLDSSCTYSDSDIITIECSEDETCNEGQCLDKECNYNGICESFLDENSFNCPSDCYNSINTWGDGFCDPTEDKQSPDC
ncbi:glycoside hydrolase family 2 TIM barrel-domain containing protein [Nanoarchaeota archaeon]